MHTIEKIGLIAGQGQLPEALLARWEELGLSPVVVGLDGITDPKIYSGRLSGHFSIGQAGHILRFLQDNHVKRVVMAGGLRRPNLWTLRTDWTGLRIVFKALCRRAGDDRLLKIIKNEIEQRGISVVGAHEFLPEILAPSGIIGRIAPEPFMNDIILSGVRAAKAHGAADRGQSVIINADGVQGVETVAGTNALIQSAHGIVGGILVKVSKPQQDLSLDMPTIGVPTIEAVKKAGLAGVAIEAGKTIILDQAEVIRLCDESGLFLIGIKGADA